MDEMILRQCDRLTGTYEMFRKREKGNDSQISLAAACLYMAYGIEADPEKIRVCRKIMRRKKGIFSDFRGVAEYVIAAKLAMQDDPEAYFDALAAMYKKLNPGVFGDERVIIAAMILVDKAADGRAEELSDRTIEIYRQMKQEHRILTSKEDMPYAALMAVSGRDAENVCARAERAYRVLKDEMKASRNTKQAISHILSFGDMEPEDAAVRVGRLAKTLRDRKHSLGGDTQAAILGTMAGTGEDIGTLADMIIEAEMYLKKSRPFRGAFGLSSRDRRMFAAICVQSALTDRDTAQDTAMIGASLTVTVVLNLILLIVVTCY